MLPVLKQRLSPQEQLDLTRELLVDSVSIDPRWVLDWMGQHLNPEERTTLAVFEEMLAR